MRYFAIPFDEICINLRAPDRKERIFAHSPSGKVPALVVRPEFVVWDSLAILEFLADRHGDKSFWPRDSEARAVARCVSAEMHAGFNTLRDLMPMDFLTVSPKEVEHETLALNIQRVLKIWRDVRRTYGSDGPFLFSDFSIADAMYAPVASRFRTYLTDLTAFGDDGTGARYIETLFAMPEMQAWASGAKDELAQATAGN